MTLADNHSPTGTEYRVPKRTILSLKDLENYTQSEAHAELTGFISSLSESVKGLTLRSQVHESKATQNLFIMLDKLQKRIAEIPAEASPSRYGNPSYQRWFDDMSASLPSLLESVPQESLSETSEYLLNSFGNRKRIDYGTGHEAHFIIFLLCLKKLDLIVEQDYPALVLKVFWKYISLMRELQFSYWLEPAGSHGVWGLDDYHFLPFLFGASQLSTHKYLTPKCIHNHEILQEFSQDYMYLACIEFVNKVKTASLRWHSPMLDDISSAKSWEKIANGMHKMYQAEVLGKLPIMQHMLFGSLYSFVGSDPSVFEEPDRGHVHAHGQLFPECCGIRVPSAIGASKADDTMRKPLPFD